MTDGLKIVGQQNLGEVVAVRGSVIDVRFTHKIPLIHNKLQSFDTDGILLEVLAHLDHDTIRCIALTPVQGLARGSTILDTGFPFAVPTSNCLLGRMFNVFGETIDGKGELGCGEWRPVHRKPPSLMQRVTSSEIFTTGIKVIDVLSPIERGGKAGLFGGQVSARQY